MSTTNLSTSPRSLEAPESAERKLTFAILGAGPTGLEAALAAAELGHDFTLYEASDRVAGHVRAWRHVRLFTPWRMNVSRRMHLALAEAGYSLPPADQCPTGAELIEHLFEPLAAILGNRIRLGVRVTSVGRQGLLKHEEIASPTRGQMPFRLLVEDASGLESLESADIVLDCTGNAQPNALGDSGVPALGERRLVSRIVREVPDLACDATSWAGRTTLLVGSGHSAQTALHSLLRLAESFPQTHIVWVLRGEVPRPIDEDPLAERHRLTSFAAEIAENPPPNVEVHRHCGVDGITETKGGRLEACLLQRAGETTESSTVVVDRILSLTGRVGDHLLYRQLQVHECYATSGPMKLAAALLAASGEAADCLQQTSHGPETLRNPEPGFFILGSKSYGRRNDFLMQVGWQQVDEIFQLLA